MTYIDAIKDGSKILVSERLKNRQRKLREYPAIHRVYYPDPNGRYESIFGDALAKIESADHQKFQKDVAMKARGKKLFEGDINPIFRCLEENYLDKDVPTPNICFFDIEVNFDPLKGFSDPWSPYAEVNAISLFTTFQNFLITLVLKPPSMSQEQADEIVAKFENTMLFNDEKDLLDAFLYLIEDVDVISGWNSSGFDVPYLVNRVKQLFGEKETARFCLWNQKPKVRTYKKFGKEQRTYDTVGIIHLDYLELYMKHNQQQLHSYRLDFVGEVEVGENKLSSDFCSTFRLLEGNSEIFNSDLKNANPENLEEFERWGRMKQLIEQEIKSR